MSYLSRIIEWIGIKCGDTEDLFNDITYDTIYNSNDINNKKTDDKEVNPRKSFKILTNNYNNFLDKQDSPRKSLEMLTNNYNNFLDKQDSSRKSLEIPTKNYKNDYDTGYDIIVHAIINESIQENKKSN